MPAQSSIVMYGNANFRGREHFPEVLYTIWQTLLIWSNLFQEYIHSSQGSALTFKSTMVLFWKKNKLGAWGP